jgi:predicted MFS family arabinose efflux permease
MSRTLSIAAALGLSVAGAAGFLVMPLILGAAVIDLDLDEAQVGYLAAVVLAGSTVSALCAAAIVRKASWHLIGHVGLGLQIVGFIITAFLDSFVPVLAAITVASLGGGITYSLALTALSDHQNASGLFGFSIAGQVLFQVIGMILLPVFLEPGGFGLSLLVLAGIAFIAFPVVRLLPPGGREDMQYASITTSEIFSQSKGIFALTGCFFFFVNIGALWAYIERIGSMAGFDPESLGQAMAAGVAFGVLGSLVASWQKDRYGLVLPLSLGTVGTLGGLALLSVPSSLVVFFAGFALYNFVWNYSLTYQYTAVAQSDTSGRFVAATPTFHGLGGTVGPIVAAMYVAPGNLMSVSVVAGSAVVISLIMFIPAVLRKRLTS